MRRRKDQAIHALLDEDINKKHIPNQYFSPLNKIFTLCLVLRIINSLLVQTYFNPDEHWQSLEVAHRIAFGYGHLTWEWRKGSRSYLHPLLFAALYKILAVLRLDSPWFMNPNIRFVLSMLPLALMFSGYSLAKLGLSELSKRKLKKSSSSYVKRLTRLQMVVFFLLLTNIPMALYMSMVHQRGIEDVIYYLSKETSENKVENILFLTPCHATPYYSTLHHDLPMRFLDCTPRLKYQISCEEEGILDESDQFLLDPLGFATNLVRDWSLPSHIVTFDAQEKLIKEFLLSCGFREVRRFFHAHFKVDRELGSSVVVYALQGY